MDGEYAANTAEVRAQGRNEMAEAGGSPRPFTFDNVRGDAEASVSVPLDDATGVKEDNRPPRLGPDHVKFNGEPSGSGAARPSSVSHGNSAGTTSGAPEHDVHITPTVVRLSQAIAWNCVVMFIAECIIEVLLLVKWLPKIPFRLDFFFMTTLSAVLAFQSLRGIREGDVDVTRNSLTVALCVELFLIIGDSVYLDKYAEKYSAVYPIRIPFMFLTSLNVFGVVWLFTTLHLWSSLEPDAADAGHWVSAKGPGSPSLRRILTETPSMVVGGLRRKSLIGRLRRAARRAAVKEAKERADVPADAKGVHKNPTFAANGSLELQVQPGATSSMPTDFLLPQWTSGYGLVQNHAMSLSPEERSEFIKMLGRLQNIEDIEAALANGETPPPTVGRGNDNPQDRRPSLSSINWGSSGKDLETGN